MNHLITCDECGNEFYLIVKERIADKDNNVIATYTRCPVCHKEYIFTYVDDDIRRLQRIQREIATKEGRPNEKLMQQFEENKRKIRLHMDYLKNKYNGN